MVWRARISWLGAALIGLGPMAGCPSSAVVGSGADGAGGHDASALPAGGQPGVPCTTDADCGNPYLTCSSANGTVCGPVSDASAADSGYVCAPATVHACTVRYNIQCQIDTDCGPAGFVCRHGPCGESIDGVEVQDCRLCDETGGGPCSLDADCPHGWSCYSPCFCPTNAPYAKGCYPPFEVFSCPGCGIKIVDGG